MRKKYIILNYAMSLSSYSNIRMPARDETCKELVIYIYLDTYILTSYIAYSKPAECLTLNSTSRDSKRRLLVYFEDFDHPTETQMLHTPLLLGALAIFVYRIMSSQCSKASKATEFPFESYGCDAKLSGGAEEIASSSDFFFKVLWSQAL